MSTKSRVQLTSQTDHNLNSTPESNLQDTFLLSLGSPGRFQVIVFLLLCTNVYNVTFNFIFITWFKTIPQHYCKIPDNDTLKYIPLQPDNELDKCHMYVNYTNHSLGVQPCVNGYYYKEYMDHTITSEWDLVCDKEYLTTLSATIFFAGVMTGGFLCGTLADILGRKPVVLFTLYSQAILGIGVAFSPNYLIFVSLKFVQGALLQGLQSSTYSLVMEMFPNYNRTIAGLVLAISVHIAHMILAGLFYLIPHWKWMQITISSMTAISLLYSWLYPESIRWLISKNQKVAAMKLVERIAKCNKIKVSQDISKCLDEISADVIARAHSLAKYDIRDLFKTPVIRRYSISLAFCWFSTGATYFGIQFYIPKMDGKYLNLFLSGALESGATIIGYFVVKCFGRRNPLIFFYLMSGAFCVATALAKNFYQGVLLPNILVIVGKLFSSQCMAFNLLYASEIFPTVIRTIGLGFVAAFSRIGAMAAPQILNIRLYSWLPFVIFGCFCVISAILHVLLPETLNVPMPNTINDLEAIDSNSSCHKISFKKKVEHCGKDNPAFVIGVEENGKQKSILTNVLITANNN